MKNVCKNDYFNIKTLPTASIPGTMELVTQNNAVKSPISDLKQPESKACVYTVEEVAQMLAISLRSAYNFHHRRVSCPPGRRKHPHSQGQFRRLAVPGRLIKEAQYGIYHQTRQLLQRPLHLSR